MGRKERSVSGNFGGSWKGRLSLQHGKKIVHKIEVASYVGQDGGYDKKLRNKMASDNARISIGI
jgi:hypothetical protein